jgi:hypothetical protein
MSKFCPFYEVEMPALKLGYCPFNFGAEKHKENVSRKTVCPAGYERTPEKKNSLCPYGYQNGKRNVSDVTATFIGKGKKLCPFYGIELPSKIGYCPTGHSFPGTQFKKDVCPFGFQSKEAASIKECPFGYKHEEKIQGSCPYGYDKMGSGSLPPSHSNFGYDKMGATSSSMSQFKQPPSSNETGSCPYGYDKMGAGSLPPSHSNVSNFGYDKMGATSSSMSQFKKTISSNETGSCPYGHDKMDPGSLAKSKNSPKKKLSKKRRDALKKRAQNNEETNKGPHGNSGKSSPSSADNSVIELSDTVCPFYNQRMPKLIIGYCPYNFGTEKHKVNESRKVCCPAGYQRKPEEANSLCPYGYQNGKRNLGEVTATLIGKGKKFCPFYGVELNSVIGYCPTGNSFPGAVFEKGVCPLGYQSKEAASNKECPFGYTYEEEAEGSCPYGYDKMGAGDFSSFHANMPSTSNTSDGDNTYTCPFGYDKMETGKMPEKISKELFDKYSGMFPEGGSCPYGYDKMFPTEKKEDDTTLAASSDTSSKIPESPNNEISDSSKSNSDTITSEKKGSTSKCPYVH